MERSAWYERVQQDYSEESSVFPRLQLPRGNQSSFLFMTLAAKSPFLQLCLELNLRFDTGAHETTFTRCYRQHQTRQEARGNFLGFWEIRARAPANGCHQDVADYFSHRCQNG
jgi:hypothetical protein